MRIVLQRVLSASVSVDNKEVATIEQGLLLLVGFSSEIKEETLKNAINKIQGLRIFPNDEGKFDRSISDINGEVLLVPQFTLYGETSKGRRPDFFKALEPELAKLEFEKLTALYRKLSKGKIETGIFGADMKVSLVNDGPVTLILEF